MGRGAKKPTINDALAYIATVKETLQDEKETYENFLKVISEIQPERTDVAGVEARVKDLFKGHKDLILGFRHFLPMQYQITFPLEDDQSSPDSVVSSNTVVGKMKALR